MEVIWKFELKVNDIVHIEMPKGAEILSVNTQNGTPCIWAKVDSKIETEKRSFAIFGTGEPLASNKMKFVHTFLSH